jgi:hypothetical protein
VGEGIVGTSASGLGATAAGGGNFACGTNGADASGTGSANTAIGLVADASGDDSVNIAIGPFANASGTTSGNIATGNEADASGDNSFNTATGLNANASGDGGNNIAIGSNANASGAGGTSNTAVGRGSTATGLNSSAFGNGASATFANSVAFGNGAQVTRADQQMFGTATNTYTMAGVTSNASKTAQGAPTQLVTSNDSGDLAAYTFAELGLASTGDVSNLQSQINGLGRRDKELTEGIATVAALAQPMLLPGQHFAMRAGWGGYDDASAVGFSAAGVVASNLLSQGRGTLTLDGGVGFGTSEGEVAGRAGASFGW